jgi:putative hydrolase of the HAD superfamily/pyrimidine and pyridine-specific 5'-nucleotidase
MIGLVLTSIMVYLFIDCDDTIYRDNWRLAEILTEKINAYTTKELNLPEGRAYELYKKHGTCLRGLQLENFQFDVEDFLFRVHELPISDHIKRDEELRGMLHRINNNSVSTCIFTASIREHAIRCLKATGIYSFFKDKPIIDVRSVNFHTKHDIEALEAAQEIMKCPRDEAQKCILVDDSRTNIRVAKMAGWKTVMIGYNSRDGESQRDFEYADHVIDKLIDLEKVHPDLFLPMTNPRID